MYGLKIILSYGPHLKVTVLVSHIRKLGSKKEPAHRKTAHSYGKAAAHSRGRESTHTNGRA